MTAEENLFPEPPTVIKGIDGGEDEVDESTLQPRQIYVAFQKDEVCDQDMFIECFRHLKEEMLYLNQEAQAAEEEAKEDGEA